MQSLLEASRRVHSTIRLDDVLAGVLEIAAKELEAQGAFFVSGSPELQARATVYGDVPDDWSRWTESADTPGYAGAVLPGERGETLAHLVVYREEPLSLEETDFLEGLALQSALAIGNAQHHERTIEWERVKLDLDAARAIQRSLLPHSVPQIAGYRLNFRSTTCYEVGGDYVDAVLLPDGKLMIVLADVAGKGLASAMISTTFRSSFRAIAGAAMPLHEMAARLNNLHWEEGTEARRRYVTAILACLDPSTHTMEAVNCGHNPAFVVSGTASGTARSRIGASGPPLGMLRDRSYEIETIPVPEGTQILLYTDGLTEVFLDDEEFGEDRLMDLVGDAPSPDLLDTVWHTLARYSGGARQTDDMTALYLCRVQEPGPPKEKTIERLPNRLGFEKVAMSTAASVADLMGFSPDRIEDLKTAVAEACINAMEHGNKLNELLGLVVTMSMGEESLEVKIRDHGPGIQEPAHVPDIDRKMLGEEDPRGMGMFLIQALVDEVEYVSGQPVGGNYARLTIHLHPGEKE